MDRTELERPSQGAAYQHLIYGSIRDGIYNDERHLISTTGKTEINIPMRTKEETKNE